MSKKIAEGTDALVLDVKFGAGAFFPDPERGRELAETMVELGEANGVRTAALQTAMDTVLGRGAGNGLEVTESVETLAGGGPADLVEVTVALAREMLALAGLDADDPADVLASGRALPVWRAMVAAQGGDPDAPIPTAPEIEIVRAHRSGILDASRRARGRDCAWRLGAGRARKEHPVSAVGRRRVPGQAGRHASTEGAVLLELHVDDPARSRRRPRRTRRRVRDRRRPAARTSPRPRPHRIATRETPLIFLALVALAAGLTGCASSSDSADAQSATTTDATDDDHDRPRRAPSTTDTTLQRIDLDVDGTPRYALVHLPAGWDGTTSVPLVLSFHGLGSNAAQQMSNDNFSCARGPRRVHRRLSECRSDLGPLGAAWKLASPDDDIAVRRPHSSTHSSRRAVHRPGTGLRDRALVRRRDDRPRRMQARGSHRGSRTGVRVHPAPPCDSTTADADVLRFTESKTMLLPYDGGGTSAAGCRSRTGARPSPNATGCDAERDRVAVPTDGRATRVLGMRRTGRAVPRPRQRAHVARSSARPRPRRDDRLLLGQGHGPAVPVDGVLRLTPEQFADSISLANQDIDASAMIWDFFSEHTLNERD